MWGIRNTQPNLHFFPIYTGIQALCWPCTMSNQAVPVFTDPVPPSTRQYRLILTQYLLVPLIIHHFVRHSWIISPLIIHLMSHAQYTWSSLWLFCWSSSPSSQGAFTGQIIFMVEHCMNWLWFALKWWSVGKICPSLGAGVYHRPRPCHWKICTAMQNSNVINTLRWSSLTFAEVLDCLYQNLILSDLSKHRSMSVSPPPTLTLNAWVAKVAHRCKIFECDQHFAPIKFDTCKSVRRFA